MEIKIKIIQDEETEYIEIGCHKKDERVGEIVRFVKLHQGSIEAVRQEMIRNVMRLLLLIVILLAFMFAGREITPEIIQAAAGVAVSVVIIYILVNAILWWLDARTAKIMTEDLIKFQENNK